MDIPQSVVDVINKCISSDNIFDRIIRHFEDLAVPSLHSMTELRKHNKKKILGDLWEHFCKLYLEFKGYTVYYIKSLPDTLSQQLNISNTRDIGIDLIAFNQSGYIAVQCKYRKTKVPWKELSTFYASCNLTGPYIHKFIMTSSSGITYNKGIPKDPLTKVIAYGTFKRLNSMDFASMVQSTNTVNPPITEFLENNVDLSTLREKRLMYFNQ